MPAMRLEARCIDAFSLHGCLIGYALAIGATLSSQAMTSDVKK